MITFSKDKDILRYEPVLFGDLHFAWQVLCAGEDGELDGSSFTAAGQDLISVGVEVGGVIYLRSSDGGIDGAYEIVSVDSMTELTVSVLRSDEDGGAVNVGSGSGLSYRVSTFAPQANEVLVELCKYFGLSVKASLDEYTVDDIADADVLKQASVYAVMAGIYATLAGGGDDGHGFWAKSLYYQKLFEKARERCRFSIDVGGDGSVEDIIAGGHGRLVRD